MISGVYFKPFPSIDVTFLLKPHLTLICGENGTFKTRLLQRIKEVAQGESVDGGVLRVLAISPKRNAERRAAEALLSEIRQQNRNLDRVIEERRGLQFNDSTFERLPSLAELYYLTFLDRCKDGGDQRGHMESVTNELSSVIASVFPSYAIDAEWNARTGLPDIVIRKHHTNKVPLDGLSLGEQEVLSLVLNLHVSRSGADLFLIDEPEVHLNWFLEERLFQYLKDFAEQNGRQVVVATHSRAAFQTGFIEHATFLYWDEKATLRASTSVPQEIRDRLAGDAIRTVLAGKFSTRTFFVEDETTRLVLNELARAKQKRIEVIVCGNSANVRTMFYRQLRDGGWPDAYFIIDGDDYLNDEDLASYSNLVRLDAYCVENFLLDPDYLALVLNSEREAITTEIVSIIKDKKSRAVGKGKALAFLLQYLTPAQVSVEHLRFLDGSEVLKNLLRLHQVSEKDFMRKYIDAISSPNSADSSFSPSLTRLVNEATELPTSASTAN